MLYDDPDEPMPEAVAPITPGQCVAIFLAGCVFSAAFGAALFWLFFCGR